MYGHLHVILKDFILEIAGETTWLKILKESGNAEKEAELLELIEQDDAIIYGLVGAACKVLNIAAPDALLAFGRHFVKYALRSGNTSFLKAQGTTLPGFMANINNLHQNLERDHLDARFPFFEVEYTPPAEEAKVTYLSTREGLSPVVVGAIQVVGEYVYGVDVELEPTAVPADFAEAEAENKAATWNVRWKPRPSGPAQLEALPKASWIPFPMLHKLVVDFTTQWSCCRTASEEQPSCEGVTTRMLAMASNNKVQELQRVSDEEARDLLMRGAPAQNVAASWTDSTLMECRPFWTSAVGRGEDYDKSTDCRTADAFISHSWSPPQDWHQYMGQDVVYADFKATTLSIMAKDIAVSRNMPECWGNVMFWVDKCCIPQDVPELKMRCILLIDYFLSKCKQICVIFTWTYLERLWCVFEWATFLASKDPNDIHLEVQFFIKGETMRLYLAAVRNFSLANTKCFVETDRDVLQAKITECYTSSEAFENLVRVTAVALMARSMAYAAGRSSKLRQEFYQPWVSLAAELGFHELSAALDTCNSEQWRADAAVRHSLSTSKFLHNGLNGGKYRKSINSWFEKTVSPLLYTERKHAVKAAQ